MNDLNAILQAMNGGSEEQAKKPVTQLQAQTMALSLQDALADYNTKHDFKPGDLVEFKPSMGIFNKPALGEPAIIVKVLDPPITAGEETGSPHEAEPRDVIFGVFAGRDRDFVLYYGIAARFQPFVQREL